jgi:hypothetical protein
MEADQFDILTRSLGSPSSRRWVVGGLARGLGGLAPLTLVGAASARKKGKRKKKRCSKKRFGASCPEQPFCAAKDCTADVRCERSGVPCFCRHRPDTGEPFCSQVARIVNDCAECADEELCAGCLAQVTCSLPCPDPV